MHVNIAVLTNASDIEGKYFAVTIEGFDDWRANGTFYVYDIDERKFYYKWAVPFMCEDEENQVGNMMYRARNNVLFRIFEVDTYKHEWLNALYDDHIIQEVERVIVDSMI